jgi:hypothetical protein
VHLISPERACFTGDCSAQGFSTDGGRYNVIPRRSLVDGSSRRNTLTGITPLALR